MDKPVRGAASVEGQFPPLLTQSAPGTLLFGGARMAIFDIGDGFWAIYRQLEALVGRGLAEAVIEQAGANGGASFARAFIGSRAGGEDEVQVLRDCVAAYQAAGFGRFEIDSIRWPIGRAVVRATDTFEAWMLRRHGEKVASPACAYTSGVLVGFVNAIAGRRDIVCVERKCQALGARECLFELLPADRVINPRAVSVDPDPALSYQLNLLGVLFDRMPMGIAVFDKGLVLRRCNPTFDSQLRRYGRRPRVRITAGMSFEELIPGIGKQIGPVLTRALAGETVRLEALRVQVTRDVVTYWDVVLTPVFRTGEVDGVVIVMADATERVLAYQTLEQRVEERTREIERREQVAEGLRDTLTVLNSNRPLGDILDHLVSQASRLLGADAVAVYRLDPETQLLGIQSARGLPEQYVANARLPVGQGAVGQAVLARAPVALPNTAEGPAVVYSVLDTHLHTYLVNTRERYRALLAVPLVIKDEVYGGIVLYYRSPRTFTAEEEGLASTFAVQAALAIENARLRERAEQSAVAAERSRLARDLHDAVTQTLFSASLIAEVLPRIWDRDAAQGRARLDELRQLTRGALAEMRTLLLELRPSALVEAALGDVLRHLCEATTGRSRVPVKLTVEGQRALPPEVQIAFYRIAQEALNNVAKHSGAASAEVRVKFEPGRVVLAVIDDGHGFDPSKVPPDHLGLGIMCERAAAVGANLEIDSQVGAGTRVTVTWEEGRVDETR